MSKKNNDRYIVGTIIGATVGVVVGLLTAPKSGEETREEIKAKAQAFKEEAACASEEAKKVQKPIDTLKKQARDVVKRGKKSFKDAAGKS